MGNELATLLLLTYMIFVIINQYRIKKYYEEINELSDDMIKNLKEQIKILKKER